MSSPSKSDGVAAAHPPAVKAGGMRIVQNKTHLNKKTDTPVVKPEDGDALKVQNSPPKSNALTSGAPNKGNADFPADAVQAFHSKPIPTHDMSASNVPKNIIHQPRK